MAKLALRQLYLDELRDLYDSENRLVKALPKLAKEAESQELRAGGDSDEVDRCFRGDGDHSFRGMPIRFRSEATLAFVILQK